MRRSIVLVLCGPLVALSLALWPAPASAQKRQRVALPEGTILAPGSRPVVSLDGSVGFVVPAVGDTVVAFAVRTGEVVGRLEGLGNATAITLSEGSRRLLVLTFANEPGAGRPAAVAVVDATDPSALAATAIFRLPDTLELTPGARPEVARGQKFGIVAISAPVAALISFDLETGEQVGALTLDGAPDAVSAVEHGDVAELAALSAAANKVALVSVSDAGVLLPVSTFVPPDDAPLSTANNVAFDAAGDVAYVASLRGRALLSFSVETGELVDKLLTGGSPARIAVYHTADHEVVAVANVSRPGGASEDDVAPKADETPLGLPGAVVVDSDAGGRLVERSRFYPETGEEIAPTNNPAFSADGATVFVPARTGSLYLVDAATGQARSREGLDSRVQSIAAAPLAEAVAVVEAGGSEGHIDIVPTSVAPAEETKPDAGAAPPDGTASDAPARDEAKREEAKRDSGPPVITRLERPSVQSGRQNDLPLTIIGSGFAAGATAVVRDAVYSALVGPNGRRANFTLSASLLAAPASIPVQVRNPDGSLSNAVNLEVVSPFAPIIAKIHPNKIFTTDEGLDLRVLGDHFRDGALAKVTYLDASGTTQTVELKTYRLSFTTIVARLPQKLTDRAEDFNLTITDRDGTTVSAPEPFQVLGPTIASVTPERLVAGDVGGEEGLALHVVGENFHQDAAVYVKRPARGANDDGAPFRLIPSASVRWKSAERLVVNLTGADVAYSGNLVVRVVNPVQGEKRRNGDSADATVTVAGPVITSSAPDVVIAGSDAFFLKLTGTDFRRTAVVKLQRDAGGQAQKRVVVDDDPNFKDRKQINVEMNTPELLRLVAKPGTLTVRVINPNGSNGDPSPALTLQVVAPGILGQPELAPSADDPDVYRLTIAGQYFREGAVVQIYDADGNAVGPPVETKFKSAEKLVVLLSRARVTTLRNFKVVVINPGGPYNADGIPSNPADVSAN